MFTHAHYPGPPSCGCGTCFIAKVGVSDDSYIETTIIRKMKKSSAFTAKLFMKQVNGVTLKLLWLKATKILFVVVFYLFFIPSYIFLYIFLFIVHYNQRMRHCDSDAGVKVLFLVALTIVKAVLGSREQVEACHGFYETLDCLKKVPQECLAEEVFIPQVVWLEW